jgi:hypothetical protein
LAKEPLVGVDRSVGVDEIFERVRQRTVAQLTAAGNGKPPRRIPGMARAGRTEFSAFVQRILDNDPTLGECASRVLRLKPTLDLNTTTFEIDMVLEALQYNYRVEALYIHNFEDVSLVHYALIALEMYAAHVVLQGVSKGQKIVHPLRYDLRPGSLQPVHKGVLLLSDRKVVTLHMRLFLM